MISAKYGLELFELRFEGMPAPRAVKTGDAVKVTADADGLRVNAAAARKAA